MSRWRSGPGKKRGRDEKLKEKWSRVEWDKRSDVENEGHDKVSPQKLMTRPAEDGIFVDSGMKLKNSLEFTLAYIHGEDLYKLLLRHELIFFWRCGGFSGAGSIVSSCLELASSGTGELRRSVE